MTTEPGLPALLTSHVPISSHEVVSCKNVGFWRAVIDAGLFALRKNQTWKFSARTEGKNILTKKWVYRGKESTDSSSCIEMPKAGWLPEAFIKSLVSIIERHMLLS